MVIINSWERQHLPIILGPGWGRKVKVRSQPGLHSKFCVKNKIGNINNALIIFNSVCHQAKNHWRELGHFSVSVLLRDTCQKITRSRDLSRALHTRVHSNISHSCWGVETSVNSGEMREKVVTYVRLFLQRSRTLFRTFRRKLRPAQKTFTEGNKLHTKQQTPHDSTYTSHLEESNSQRLRWLVLGGSRLTQETNFCVYLWGTV